MAPHSSTLAWKIPWMEEPGRLQSMGSLSWLTLIKCSLGEARLWQEKEGAGLGPGSGGGREKLWPPDVHGCRACSLVASPWAQGHPGLPLRGEGPEGGSIHFAAERFL